MQRINGMGDHWTVEIDNREIKEKDMGQDTGGGLAGNYSAVQFGTIKTENCTCVKYSVWIFRLYCYRIRIRKKNGSCRLP